ncbi:type II toxin-antitoxin system death-on-curing family toxin [Corynebacterium sp. sy017]|uniref:type II toxin-antitoxin system death-on-curing family toxin n=1 Tax=unclassified Corynebacterium TaxID=2624378 RepID=UPI001184B3CC|nr:MULTISPECIES: type II toxin-antitoxin system death-on-curing family toxin [unclassified Corynebacterium]MBP3088373.1 type II toxin-antitoxin system death-on-curing family toxin [Corynebacterium sp. sy017]QDZ41822.1 type II toxin-antitoxin system death-on-curing family toxin [Corynebacterium sp. sy039]TSD91689.1 type II toxin-antitoxin system death-on-curing family toxin [Corynebacterium sp. SY003]
MTHEFRLDIDVVIARNAIINRSDVASCLLDRGKLESALARPLHTFDKELLYPTIFHRAAALLEGIAAAHAFYDGNKRTAWLSCSVYLELNGIDIEADPVEAGQLVVALVNHKIDVEYVASWLIQHMQ